MSRKYLIIFIFIFFISISVVSASENMSSDVIFTDNNSEITNLGSSHEYMSLDNDYDDYGEDYDSYGVGVLKPTKLSTTYNSGKSFKVKVVSYDDKTYPLEDVRLKLRVYGKNSYRDYYEYTNYKGIANFKVYNLPFGINKVRIFSADDYIVAKKVTSYIKISKAKTKVGAPKITTKYHESKKFKIKIKYKTSKNPVRNVKISVKVGNKKLTLKTNSKGVASFNTKSLGVGTYKVIIKSKNSNYKINAKSKIVIKKIAKKTSKKSGAKKTSRKKSSSSSKSSYYGGGNYVASQNSNKFHYSSCGYTNRIKSYNLITFSSRSQAINNGYSPCSRCNP